MARGILAFSYLFFHAGTHWVGSKFLTFNWMYPAKDTFRYKSGSTMGICHVNPWPISLYVYSNYILVPSSIFPPNRHQNNSFCSSLYQNWEGIHTSNHLPAWTCCKSSEKSIQDWFLASNQWEEISVMGGRRQEATDVTGRRHKNVWIWSFNRSKYIRAALLTRALFVQGWATFSRTTSKIALLITRHLLLYLVLYVDN